jgi:hypothetical protein
VKTLRKVVLFGLAAIAVEDSMATENYKLNSPLVEMLDGKPYAIDGEVFHLIIQMRRKVRQILFGFQNEAGQLVGWCEFDGQMYSVSELSIIESQCEQDYNSRIAELTVNKNNYSPAEWHKEFDDTTAQFNAKKALLRTVLEKAKEDFLTLTAPYMGCMKFKDVLLGLIQESCNLRNNRNCFLLNWGKESAGHEGVLLRRDLITFKDFEKFCIDLTDYLGDMAESCPKAKAMFIEILKKKKAQGHS